MPPPKARGGTGPAAPAPAPEPVAAAVAAAASSCASPARSTPPTPHITITSIDAKYYTQLSAAQEKQRTPKADTQHTPAASTALTVAAPATAAPMPAAVVVPVESVSQRAMKEAAGGLGGSIFSACCVYPIDFIKTRMQLPNSPITSVWGGGLHIAQTEGFLTLYTGLGSELVKASVQSFSYFYWYFIFKEVAQLRMMRSMPPPSLEDAAASSSIIGSTGEGGRSSGFLRLNSPDGEGGSAASAAAELRLHQARCVDAACFCRSESHVAAHSEAHKRSQVEEWRIKALLHRQHKHEQQRARARAQQQQQQQQQLQLHADSQPNSSSVVPHALPRLMPSVSEPSLSVLSQHDLDDSPYVDVRSVDSSAFITNTATLLAAPTDALAASAGGGGTPISPIAVATLPPPPPPQLSIGLQLFLGTIAGCLTQLLVNPVSVIQTRMMTQSKLSASGAPALGFFALTANIIRTEGIQALFAGLLPAFILSSNPSIQFLVFDRLKALVLRVLSQSAITGRQTLSVPESFILGAVSKIVATLVTYPYILAKMRLQYKGDSSGGAKAVVYKGTIDVLVRTVKYEGITGLYVGLQAQLLKSVLGAALMFMAKEKLSDLAMFLQQRFASKPAPALPAPAPAALPAPAAAPAPAATGAAPAPPSLAPPAVRLSTR